MGLQQQLKSDKVEQLKLRKPAIVGMGATVRETVAKMREVKVGCAVVVDDENKAAGVFTEAMLRSRLVQDASVIDESVKDNMATIFAWVRPSDSVETVLDSMDAKNTRFLVVLDDAKHVVGLTGQKGLMEYVAEFFPHEVMVQYVGPNPHSTQREGA